MARNQQQMIAGLMDRLNPLVESPLVGAMTMGDNSSLRDDHSMGNDTESVAGFLSEPSYENHDEDEGHFNATQLKIAKRFVELMGGADKARAAIDKVDECEDCLDLIDDDRMRADSESSMISKMAGMLPGTPDLPMGLSNLYNPANGASSM